MGRRKHSFDIVFALLLFAGFAACSMLLVLLGAKIYGRTAEKMNTVDAPVILAYLTEKLRCCDGESAVSVGEDGSLQIKKTMEGKEYVTWIYTENGSLKETLIEKGKKPIANAGTEIGRINSFKAELIQEHMLQFRVTDSRGQSGSRCYAFPH